MANNSGDMAGSTAPAPSNRNNSLRCIAPPRRKLLFSDQFLANIFQNVGGALDANFAGENWVFVFNAEDALIIDVHVGLQNRFPERSAVTVSDGAECV